ITLYPNPNTGKFILEGSILYNGSVQLEISNALGQVEYTGELVTENNSLHKEMELSHPTPGIYFLKIKTADGTGVIRFTVR
ncbi:MAG TPA: T9SS type A sorting domain-containing protein, partial [Flavipsychrobacter sp.]